MDHIEVTSMSKCCNVDDLKQVEMSARSESCTKHIIAINVNYKGSDFIICDSPGIGDTRGPEIDIANTYGLVKAAQACKQVLPIILLSSVSMGERMTGLK